MLSSADKDFIIIRGIPRRHVLKPSHSIFRLSDQTFELGDRVISTVEEGGAPTGAKGTVVGIDGRLLDVIFDQPILGGSDLDGRCSSDRALVVGRNTVLNLTNKQPPVASNAPRVKKQRNVSADAPTQPVPNQWTQSSNKIFENPRVAGKSRQAPSKDLRTHGSAPSQLKNSAEVEVEMMLKQMLHIGSSSEIATNTIVESRDEVSQQLLDLLHGKSQPPPKQESQHENQPIKKKGWPRKRDKQ